MENKKVVLIAEDESILRNALKDKLTLEGMSVLEAKNGEEGLEIALRENPDIILVDIIMPKMDGVTMLQKLHDDENGKKIKFIILTNADDTDEIARAMRVVAPESGSFDYFVKTNIAIDEVVEKVKDKVREKLSA